MKVVIKFAAVMLLAATSSFALDKVDGVFQIATCKDLLDYADSVKTYSANYSVNAVVTAHIDMDDEYSTGVTCNQKGFTGIGDSTASGSNIYKGVFDGQGYVISNLTFDDGGKIFYQNMGLFASLQYPGTIQNVILENVSIVSSGTNSSDRTTPASVGALVGWMRSGFILNCYVTGTITSSGKKNGVGGLVGYMDGGKIKDCLSAVTVRATGGDSTSVGGIAGYAVSVHGDDHSSSNPVAVIETCVYDGDSLVNEGIGYTGGIVGNSTGADGSKTSSTFSGNYYNSTALASGAGAVGTSTTTTESEATGTADLNTPEIACNLNGGTWKNDSCTDGGDTWGNGSSITNGGASTDALGNITYTITFDANQGTFPDGATTAKYLEVGTSITGDEITTPTRDGYTFVGWSKNSGAESADASLGTVVQADTIYAVWKEQVTVTFVANTGNLSGAYFSDSSVTKSKKVDYGAVISSENIGSPVDFTLGEGENKVYYTFMGWSISATAAEPDACQNVAESSTTMYAVWQIKESVFYTLTFNANGHGSAPEAERVESDHYASAPTSPTATGYTFVGWYYNSYGTGSSFDFENTAITADVTLYAKWTPVSYTITYHSVENADNSANPSNYTADSDNITLQSPDSTGFNFEGWFYDAELTNPATTISAGSTGDKDFYAKWSIKTFSISFLSGGNSKGSLASIVKTYDVTITLPGASFTSTDGQSQNAGWSYTDGGEKAFDLGAEYALNEDATFYPYWNTSAKHTIYYAVGYYDAAGNKVADSTKFTEVDLDYNTHTLATPTAVPGYTFAGWDKVYRVDTTTTTGKGPSKTTTTTKIDTTEVAVTQNKFKMTATDVYVYGKFVLDTYTITYSNLGSQTNDNVTEYTVLSNDITLVEPGDSTKYAFNGWYDNSQLTGDAVTEIAMGSTGNKTLYAKWRRIDYGSVKISADGKTVFVESDSIAPVELTEEGIEVENIVFERKNLEPGIVATVVLPFDLPEGSSVNATFCTFSYIEAAESKWVAHFKKLSVLPVADVPYVFILNSDADSLRFMVNGKAVVHSGDIQNTTSGDWTFVGTYEYHQWTSSDPDLGLVYGFSALTEANIGKGKFGKAAENCIIRPTRAYLKKRDASITLPSGMPSLRGTSSVVRTASTTTLPDEIDVSFDDEEDEVMAIGKMNTVTGQIKIDYWVDLKGRSSIKKPSARGAYFNKKMF